MSSIRSYSRVEIVNGYSVGQSPIDGRYYVAVPSSVPGYSSPVSVGYRRRADACDDARARRPPRESEVQR